MEFVEQIVNYFQGDGVTLAKNLTFIIIFFLIIRIVIRLLKNSVNRTKRIEKTIPNFVISLLNIGLIVIWAFYAANLLFGVSADAFVTIASVFSLGVSLALQDTIASLANGILIIVNQPFVEGEFITCGDASGTVVSITMFSTVLKTADGIMVTIPNSTVTANNVVNYSRLPTRRLDIVVPVSYNSDTEQVKKLMNEVISETKGVLEEPASQVILTNYGDSNLEFTVRVWTPADIYWDIRFAMYEAILAKLRANNISIDYNQYDIHIKDGGVANE